jgi:DNA invertase Pin-like site-specific DNA recombinase
VLDQLRPGDTLVAWKLDRLGRSLRHLIDTITDLADRGIGFRSLQEAIDTTTPVARVAFAERRRARDGVPLDARAAPRTTRR